MKTIVSLHQAMAHIGFELGDDSLSALVIGLIADSGIFAQSGDATFGEAVSRYRCLAEGRQVEFYFDRALRLVGHVFFSRGLFCGEFREHAFADSPSPSMDGEARLIRSMSCRDDLALLQFGRFISDHLAPTDALFISNELAGRVEINRLDARLVSRVKAGFSKRQSIELTRNGNLMHQRRQSFSSIAEVGAMLGFLQEQGHHDQIPLSKLGRLVKRLHRMGYSRRYRDPEGRITGILLWAWLTEPNIERLRRDGPWSFHMSELCDGNQLVVLLATSVADGSEALLADLASGLHPDETELSLNGGSLCSPGLRHIVSRNCINANDTLQKTT